MVRCAGDCCIVAASTAVAKHSPVATERDVHRTSGIPDNSSANQLVTVGHLIYRDPKRYLRFCGSDVMPQLQPKLPNRLGHDFNRDGDVREFPFVRSGTKQQLRSPEIAQRQCAILQRFASGTSESDLQQQCGSSTANI